MGVTIFPDTTEGVSWTAISTPSISGTTATLFSSLSGYKHYKLVFSNLSLASTGPLMLRLNENSDPAYYNTTGELSGTTSSSGAFYKSGTDGVGAIFLTGTSDTNAYYSGTVTISNANLVGNKVVDIDAGWYNSNGFYIRGRGSFSSTAAITQIRLFANSNFAYNGVTLYGGN